MKEENIGSALVSSLLMKRAIDVAKDVAEIALDSALDSGILKDIPVFGWVAKGFGTVFHVRERVFLKKIALFLSSLRRISEEDREEFKQSIERKPKEKLRIGENLVLLLERQEDFDKAYFLGICFAAYVKNEISYDTFHQLAYSIDRAYVGDLHILALLYEQPHAIGDKEGTSLYSAGLIGIKHAITSTDGGTFSEEPTELGFTEIRYVRNELGSILAKIIRAEEEANKGMHSDG